MQDYTAMASLVSAFEQVRQWKLANYAPELEPDDFARALMTTLDDVESRHELSGATIRVDLTSSLGRRAHRLGLLVRRRRG